MTSKDNRQQNAERRLRHAQWARQDRADNIKLAFLLIAGVLVFLTLASMKGF